MCVDPLSHVCLAMRRPTCVWPCVCPTCVWPCVCPTCVWPCVWPVASVHLSTLGRGHHLCTAAHRCWSGTGRIRCACSAAVAAGQLQPLLHVLSARQLSAVYGWTPGASDQLSVCESCQQVSGLCCLNSTTVMGRCCVCGATIVSLRPAAGADQQECGGRHSCWHSSISSSHRTAALSWQHPRQQQTHVRTAAWQLTAVAA
jgi:hypothetical protein